jgi:hypothetical protein
MSVSDIAIGRAQAVASPLATPPHSFGSTAGISFVHCSVPEQLMGLFFA